MRIFMGLAVMAAQPAWATATNIPVPEPTSLALLGMAAAGVVAAFRVGRRK